MNGNLCLRFAAKSKNKQSVFILILCFECNFSALHEFLYSDIYSRRNSWSDYEIFSQIIFPSSISFIDHIDFVSANLLKPPCRKMGFRQDAWKCLFVNDSCKWLFIYLEIFFFLYCSWRQTKCLSFSFSSELYSPLWFEAKKNENLRPTKNFW